MANEPLDSMPQPIGPPPLRSVAVIGAGMAGLTCARRLQDAGVRVVVFDKGRRPGGRLATREAEDFTFDHGAQFFTARSEAFQRELASWGALAQPWTPAGLDVREGQETRWVAQPSMRALGERLAQGLTVQQSVQVQRPRRVDGQWQLEDELGAILGDFDGLVVATPGPQAAALLADAPALAAQAARSQMAPCWALMLGFDAPLGLPFEARRMEAPLAWAARGASKPGRDAAESWVVHASAAWSREHLEETAEQVALQLLAAFEAATGAALPVPRFTQAHRWRYASPESSEPEGCLYDTALRAGACGDWCLAPRVEGAFESGAALAARLLQAR